MAFITHHAIFWVTCEIGCDHLMRSPAVSGFDIPILQEVDVTNLYDLWLHKLCLHIMPWIRAATKSPDLQIFLDNLMAITPLFAYDIKSDPIK